MPTDRVSAKFTHLNNMAATDAEEELTQFCGSKCWASEMTSLRPFLTVAEMVEAADRVAHKLSKSDWLEAFSHHPKIGDVDSLMKHYANNKEIAAKEQSGVNGSPEAVMQALLIGNKKYEEKFGYIFIVCASGKSAEEMVNLLQERIDNMPDKEFPLAVQEQMKITRLRLEKLLS